MLNRYFRPTLLLCFPLILFGCASQSVSQKPVPKPLVDKVVVAPVLTPEQSGQYNAALQALRSGRLSEAERGFSQLLKQHPDLAGASVNLGLIARKEGNEEQALAYFSRALESNPGNVEALLLLALKDQEDGNFWDAEAKLLKAVKVKPDFEAAHYNLGVLYELYLQETEKAIGHYQRYVALNRGEDVDTVVRWIRLLELK